MRARRFILAAMAMLAGSAAAANPLSGMFDVSVPVAQRSEPPCHICGALQQQLSRGCVGRLDDAPAADVVYLRQPGRYELPDATAAILSRAYAAADLAVATRQIAPLLSSDQADDRYAGGLFLAQRSLSLGAGFGDVFQRGMSVMSAASEETSLPTSDADFLAALEARADGDRRAARDAIDRALTKEPRYLNALVIGLDIAVEEALKQQRRGRALCSRAYGDVLSYSAALMELSPCAHQSAHLDVFLTRQHADPDQVGPVLAARVYLMLIARRADLAEGHLRTLSQLQGVSCRSAVASQLERLIETARDGSDQ